GEGIDIIIAKLAEANELRGVIDNAHFNDEAKLGKGQEMVDKLTGLIAIFQRPEFDFKNNKAGGDDILGDAYEYLMRNFATESGKSKGQFYTPAEVSRILAKVIGIGDDKRKMISIYDPTCGSGSLLLRAAAEAKGTVAIQGQEKDVATIGMARMSMVVHGVDDPDLRHGDTLTDPLHKRNDRVLNTFDYVVANPPFSVKSWLKGASEDDPFGRWGHGEGIAPVPPPKCGDYAFLLHVLKSMKPDGRAAVILPHGVLFRGNAEAEIRKFIVRRHWIKGIIGLPPNLFFGAGIPACILVLDKEGAAASKGIFVIDAKDGFAKDGAKNRLRECDVRRIVDVWNAGKDVPHYARFVPYADIEANDWNLNIPRYVQPADREVKQDLAAHLHGGIPAEEAAKYPACLFQPFASASASAGARVALAVPEDGIAAALAEDPAMKAVLAREKTECQMWLEYFRDRGWEVKKGDNPKRLIAEWGDALLAELRRARQGAGEDEEAALVSPYAIYEHLMNYWAETMQDDCFLVCRDGWQAKLSVPRKRNFSWRDLQCDLVPPEIVAKIRYQRDLEAIDAALADAEHAQARIDELCEELDVGDEPPADVAALKKKAAAAKKRAKAADAALAEKLAADYAGFGEGDVRNLVVDNKWFDALSSRFESEFDRRLAAIAAEVKALAERYAVPLPELEAEAAALRGKVLAHLKEMGVEA
ncbi:MAG: N-6 DNA methylase, partial [Kiritimatiellae bacterium]|nr:N-6 DNA methylase [Kiritimatiellia bacterium]